MSETFDAVILGTGQAGPSMAARLSGAGMKVAIVERDRFGGTCVNNGCTPTKAMVASAYAAHLARRAGDYGVVLDQAPRIDMKRVKARKDEIVRRSSEGVEGWMRGLKDAKVYQAHARFISPTQVQVGSDVLSAERFFINVGGHSHAPPAMPGIDTVPYLTSESVMGVDFIPPHLLVVGGSYVGLEFAQIFRRFGSEVTVIEMGPRLIGREDEDVSSAIQDFLAGEGIKLRLGAKCISLRQETHGVSVGLDCEDGSLRESGSHILLAVGRAPNTSDLGLDKAGIAVDERGYIVVDEGLLTTNQRAWALGDCNGKGAFTHTSYNDYEIVADNLLSNAGRKHTDRVPVYALYTDPPLGRVGMNEAEIRKAGLKARVGKRPMTRVARAIEKGETNGFLKIYVEASSSRILGASLLGTGADEVVQSLLEAVYAKLPYTGFQRHVRIHPTVGELLPTTLETLEPLV